MSIRNLMASSGYFMINKKLIKNVGIDEALVLSCMIEGSEMFPDGWFYQTANTIEELTTLSEFKQTKAINNLINLGILDKKVEGLPARRYFKINLNKLFEFLEIQFSNNLKTCLPKTLKNKDITNKDIINKNISIKKDRQSDNELKSDVVKFIQLLQNQSLRFTPSECTKIIGICEELQVNPMSSYNLSSYLRGESSLPLTKRMFLSINTYEKMKLGDYNDKQSVRKVSEIKETVYTERVDEEMDKLMEGWN